MAGTTSRRAAVVIGAMAVMIGAMAPGARAETLTSKGPYARSYTLASGFIALPCDRRNTPLEVIGPNPATGAIDVSSGLAARNCSALRSSETFAWGIPTGSLAGRGAEVTLRVRIEDIDLLERGSATRRAVVRIGTGDRSWRLASIVCRGATCSTYERQARTISLRTSVDALPETLDVIIEASSSLRDGSGAVGVAVRGDLLSVRLRA